eukprot:5433141-Prorocentrum_lima.AAC.1
MAVGLGFLHIPFSLVDGQFGLRPFVVDTLVHDNTLFTCTFPGVERKQLIMHRVADLLRDCRV